MSDQAVEGFDRDLLDPKILAKNLKKLPRDAMLLALRSGSVAVKCNALQALQLHGGLTAGEILSVGVLVKDESRSVRSAAVRALSAASVAEEAIDLLIAASGDRDDHVLADIERTIRGYGDGIIASLIERLRVDAGVADERILPHIVSFGRAAGPQLVAALSHSDERVRANAVAGLIMLGVATLIEEQPAIQELLRDRADPVRDLARQAMNAIYRRTRPSFLEPQPVPAAGFTSQALSDADAKAAAKAVDVDQLIAFARDGRAAARANAWRMFDLLGELDEYTAALAMVALKDDESKVRVSAAKALVHAPELQTRGVTYALVKAHFHGDKHVRAAIDQTLATLGPRTLAPMISLLDERDQDIARQLSMLLSRHGDKAGKPLIEAMQHIGPVVRCNAVSALTRIGGKTLEKGYAVLVGMLIETFDPARAEAVLALGAMPRAKVSKDIAVMNRLQEMLEYDASLAVRLAADATLAAIGPPATD